MYRAVCGRSRGWLRAQLSMWSVILFALAGSSCDSECLARMDSILEMVLTSESCLERGDYQLRVQLEGQPWFVCPFSVGESGVDGEATCSLDLEADGDSVDYKGGTSGFEAERVFACDSEGDDKGEALVRLRFMVFLEPRTQEPALRFEIRRDGERVLRSQAPIVEESFTKLCGKRIGNWVSRAEFELE